MLKIGEVNSYKAQPAFLEPYKKGMELAVGIGTKAVPVTLLLAAVAEAVPSLPAILALDTAKLLERPVVLLGRRAKAKPVVEPQFAPPRETFVMELTTSVERNGLAGARPFLHFG